MISEIVLALISIAATTAGIAYVGGKWHFARKNGAAVINSYTNNKDDFFPAFMRLYSFMPNKLQKKFPKFILYYLAQKGLISIRIEANGNVKVMRTGDVNISNETERHLMDSIFQDTQEYFLSDDAIVGLEAVNLNEIRQTYAKGMLSCPLGYQLDANRSATLSNPGNTFVLDKDHMENDLFTAKIITGFLGIITVLPIAVALRENEAIFIPLIGTAFLYATFAVPIKCALKGIIKNILNEREIIFKNASPLVCKAANAIRPVIDAIILFFAGFWGLIFYLWIFTSEVTGLTTLACLYCFITNLTIWFITLKKRKNKVMSYGTAENDLFEFIEFIKKKFRNLRKDFRKRSMNFDESAEYLRGTTDELIPFASLFGKGKDINALLLEEKSKLPTWINTENEMTFELADSIVDQNLMHTNTQSPVTQPSH